MRFSPRSLLAWIAVAIAGCDAVGRRLAAAMPLDGEPEAVPDDGPAEHVAPRL